MAQLKRKVHFNLSGSHHTLDSDNAFVGGFAYVTGSLTASVGVSASQIQGQQLTASYVSGSAVENFGSAGNLGGALVIQSPMFLSGTQVSSAFGATNAQFVVGLPNNNFVFGADSGSISWASGSGFKVVPSTTPNAVELWINGEMVAGPGGGGGHGNQAFTCITGSVDTTGGSTGVPSSASLVLYPNNSSTAFNFKDPKYFGAGAGSAGVGKFTINTLATFQQSFVSWTHLVTYVSDSTGLYPLSMAELDYVTSSNDTPQKTGTFDINVYADSTNGLVFGVTGAADDVFSHFNAQIVDGFVTTGGGTKTFITYGN